MTSETLQVIILIERRARKESDYLPKHQTITLNISKLVELQ